MDMTSLIAEIGSRPAHEISCRRILVPVDGSHASMHAAGWAIELARAAEAELTVLMVVDYDAHVSALEQVSTSGYMPAELKISAYRLLAELMHEIPRSIRAHLRVEEGNPGEMIVAVAAEEESNLIVMGMRGFGTFERLAFGSVSSYVSKHAQCAVLLSK
ncbi:universal stress protein [Selenomonas sp. F0473]|uniref:universal stress protein n=1 Tax=Selenomonas sp. F0473 TaxID=999423 RepID=UPI0025FCD40C|nr:universal stress protein [Selenomonas sp. F0473]